MALRLENADDLAEWAGNIPDEMRQQIFDQMPDAAGSDTGGGGAGASALQWGGLGAGDIGQDEFGFEDVFDLGLSAARAFNLNAGPVTNIGNLIEWGVRQLPSIVGFEGIGELGIGFGAEAIGDPGGDLADLSTRDDFII